MGFSPEWVQIQENADVKACFKPLAAAGTTNTILFSNGSADQNGAINDLSTGTTNKYMIFGTTSWVSTNAQTYYYTAFADQTTNSNTSVRMSTKLAARYDDAVIIRWRTGYESDDLGFHVYREVDGERTRITRSIIAGSALLGARSPLTAGQT